MIEDLTADESQEKARPTDLPVELDTGTAIDPRDYFKSTAFQKDAEQIDPDKTHPWQVAQDDGLQVSDEFGQVALAKTFDAEETDDERMVGLLLCEKATDGQSSSIYIRNELSPSARGQVADVIYEVSPRLSGETRHTFIRTLIQLLPSLENQPGSVVEEALTTLTLSLLSDHPQATEAVEIPQIGTANAEQQEQVARLLRLVSKKIPSELFFKKLNELQNNLQWMDDAFGRNYVSILAEIRGWALTSRQDTVRNYDVLRKKEAVDYPVGDKATREIASIEELEEVLKSMPAEPMPDIRFSPKRREGAEIVQLDQVLGGTGINDWTVSTAQGRGLGKIFEFSQALKDGTASVAGNNQPIKAVEIDGKYFIEADGRHRTAALKALGVKEVPMLVTHIQKT